MTHFRIVDKLQKIDEDIQRNQLNYHAKACSCEQGIYLRCSSSFT